MAANNYFLIIFMIDYFLNKLRKIAITTKAQAKIIKLLFFQNRQKRSYLEMKQRKAANPESGTGEC